MHHAYHHHHTGRELPEASAAKGELEARASKPGLTTSRRNFVTGAVLLGTFVAASLMGSRKAQAYSDQAQEQSDLPGCMPSGDTPQKCECFLRGTQILTPDGELAIEDLEIGDLVTTGSGKAVPIKWLARMRLERSATETWARDVRPIRIARGALDGQLPHRDLFVSANHSMYIEGVLIPAGDLVNGVNITRHDAAATEVLDYFHIELSGHDVIYAQGSAAETMQVHADTRQKFDNYDEFVKLYGESVATLVPYAPIVAYNGGRGELSSRLRSVIAPIYDSRNTGDIVRDRIANLAECGGMLPPGVPDRTPASLTQ